MHTNGVAITGIGLLSSLGEGVDAHWDALNADAGPYVDTVSFRPYTVHPLCEVDWSVQIPKRSDQRQMENWQRIGTYAAGLALHDAGIKNDSGLCAKMDLIVAAGGGERDVLVDTQILAEARVRQDHEILLNEKLSTELRPTLFLAQLSNLLAGNISIVHNVTGSSRTFMGEEGAGISAIETASARIRAGQSTHVLVGGSYNAQHPAMLLSYELNRMLKLDGWSPLWQREGSEGGGLVTGSGGAFLVLENEQHAAQRGARVYAVIDSVFSTQVCRKQKQLRDTVATLVAAAAVDRATDLVITGASGAKDVTAAEKAALDMMAAPVRGIAGKFGHLREAQFLLAVALAALCVSKGAAIPPIDALSEKPAPSGMESALAISIGATRAEGIARLIRA
ncbi:beta-ketoacyl-ACP synthase [Mesorhizobium sp. A623]